MNLLGALVMVRGLEWEIPLSFPVNTLLETYGGSRGQFEPVCGEWESSTTGHMPNQPGSPLFPTWLQSDGK